MPQSRIAFVAIALLAVCANPLILGSSNPQIHTALGSTSRIAPAVDPASPRTPVLVELFTSEGCSSCPPADRVLARLVDEQPVAGAEIIALGLHVDYWDRLGWRDRFSSSRYTDRQNAYARVLHTSSIYTPQAVVDGTREFIGSDWNAARRLVQEAKSASKVPIQLVLQSGADDRQVPLSIDVGRSNDPVANADVVLAIVENGLVSDVQRGENAHRRLSHTAVVRSLERVGSVNTHMGFATTRPLSLDPSWKHDALRVVAFVQDPASLRVIGVAARSLE